MRGKREFGIEEQRALLGEIAELRGQGLLAARFDAESPLLDGHVDGLGGRTGQVEDEQVGVVALQ